VESPDEGFDGFAVIKSSKFSCKNTVKWTFEKLDPGDHSYIDELFFKNMHGPRNCPLICMLPIEIFIEMAQCRMKCELIFEKSSVSVKYLDGFKDSIGKGEL